jgi:hypothetical protein
MSDNSVAVTPNSRVASGGGGPTRTIHLVRGVNRQLTLAGVGLNSFGPNPTANPVGTKEGGLVFERRSLRARFSGCPRPVARGS